MKELWFDADGMRSRTKVYGFEWYGDVEDGYCRVLVGMISSRLPGLMVFKVSDSSLSMSSVGDSITNGMDQGQCSTVEK